jgi:hypothetical protein
MAAAAMASLELGPWREAQTRGMAATPRGGRERKEHGAAWLCREGYLETRATSRAAAMASPMRWTRPG